MADLTESDQGQDHIVHLISIVAAEPQKGGAVLEAMRDYGDPDQETEDDLGQRKEATVMVVAEGDLVGNESDQEVVRELVKVT